MATKSRAELKREYRERPREAGIYQIRNRESGKILLGSSRNLHGPLNRHRFALRVGKHANPALQRDFHEQGEDAFDFEILEVVKVKDEPGFSVDDELTLLEEIWLEKLSPFGERGYNTKPGLERD
jgi:group I intron endonuclease